MCARVIGLGGGLSSGFVIRVAVLGKRSLMARPHEKKLELARRVLKVINCQSFFCVCCKPEANRWLKGL